MGAFPEDTVGFLIWLDRKFPGKYPGDDFVPRHLFGKYLFFTVDNEVQKSGATVSRVHDAVVPFEPLGDSFELLLATGRTVLARGVVLALGIPQSRAPWRHVDSGVPRRYVVHDPWDPGALEGLDAEASVVVVGSGLTSIDVITGLRQRGHRGSIVLVSRGGRFPLPHTKQHADPVSYDPAELALGVDAALAAVRREARRLIKEGKDWQPAIDGVRPHTTATWKAWSDVDRACLLNRLKPFWEIHRHRAPARALESIEVERWNGTIRLVAGSIHALRPGADGRAAVVVRSSDGTLLRLSADRVVNCAVPAASVGETLDPLIGSMLRMGRACFDGRGLGLRTDPEGRLVSALGLIQPRLHLVGALGRGELWKSPAVPELRQQAATVASSLAGELGLESPRQAA